jgi:hypothetical protein
MLRDVPSEQVDNVIMTFKSHFPTVDIAAPQGF